VVGRLRIRFKPGVSRVGELHRHDSWKRAFSVRWRRSSGPDFFNFPRLPWELVAKALERDHPNDIVRPTDLADCAARSPLGNMLTMVYGIPSRLSHATSEVRRGGVGKGLGRDNVGGKS